MLVNRREFLSTTTTGYTLLAAGLSVPRFLARSAMAVGGPSGEERILVVLQLTGGNDGLNTVIPYRDDEYYKARPVVGIPRGQVLTLNDDVGLHPRLDGIKALFDQGRVAVIQGVGYPNPNRSHFESMDIWHTCCTEPREQDGTGWLGRAVEQMGDSTMPAVHVDATDVPLALRARGAAIPSIDDVARFRLDVSGGMTADTIRKVAARTAAAASDDLMFVQRTTLAACDQAEQLARAMDGKSHIAYPDFGLGEHLRLIANLIAAGIGARIYYTSLSGFDTHARQRAHHDQLLGQLSSAIKAFYDDLDARGLSDRVLLMTFSEFGRRTQENYSEGTDHGAAAPMLLIGPGVSPGVHGAKPDLTDLDDGDLRMQVDFRSVYAALLKGWLAVDPVKVLRRGYPLASVIR